MKKLYGVILVVLYVSIVFYLASTTPITPHEAKIFYQQDTILSYLMHFGYDMSPTFLGMRIVFVLFGLLSIYLYYLFAKEYFKENSKAIKSTSIFMLLPGVLTASIIANISIIVISFLLVFFICYLRKNYILMILPLLGLFFVHEASIILFIAIFLYALNYKDKVLAILSSIFLASFVYLAKGIDISGRPSGYFMDIFGLYASIFSPLLFLYFVFVMYRILLREKKDIIWYVSFVALIVSFILSIRQKVHITDFAPYVSISIVLMVALFDKTLKVRLPQFQKRYKFTQQVVFVSLFITLIFISANKLIFDMLHNKSEHFAYKTYYPYVTSISLHKQDQQCINNMQDKYKYQYLFYGITKCHK